MVRSQVTSVLTERLGSRGMLVQGPCGHLRINIHESNSTLGVKNKMIYCSLKRHLQLVFI